MLSIRNVKISVKVKCLCLNNANKLLQLQGISVKTFLNYITFTNKFSYVLFKSSSNGTNHVNVTKIKDTSNIHEALAILQDCLNTGVISHKIDNIIATHNGPQMIDLQCLIRGSVFHRTKYNPERFPGLFVKCEGGTAIIFHSGKVVIVGCKSIEQLWHLFNYVVMKLKS